MPVISGGNIIAGAVARTLELSAAAVPTVNVTGLGVAAVGTRYTNTATGVLYICTATNTTSTITWAVVGAQV